MAGRFVNSDTETYYKAAITTSVLLSEEKSVRTKKKKKKKEVQKWTQTTKNVEYDKGDFFN